MDEASADEGEAGCVDEESFRGEEISLTVSLLSEVLDEADAELASFTSAEFKGRGASSTCEMSSFLEESSSEC